MKISLLAFAVAGCGVALAAPAATTIVSHDAAIDASVAADGSIAAHVKDVPTLFGEPCRAPYHLEVKEEGGWTKVMTDLPSKGNYWLDGEHHGYGMCDYSPCRNEPGLDLSAHLQGYRQTGTKDGAPVFERYEVKGTIKVTFVYSTTPKCEFTTAEVIVNRP